MERRGSGGAYVCCERLDLIVDLISIVSDDPRVKAIICMASYEEGELFSIRKLARCVGLAPKNMARYVEELRSRGIIECVYESPKLRLYKIGLGLNLRSISSDLSSTLSSLPISLRLTLKPLGSPSILASYILPQYGHSGSRSSEAKILPHMHVM